MIYENLLEDDFYLKLDRYVFDICKENEQLSFWRYYSCITNTCLPYYQIDFTVTTVLTAEEYDKSIANINMKLLRGMMGIIVSDKTQNNSFLIGYFLTPSSQTM